MSPDLICLSHLRWDFVYQRPNHLMARAARDRRVFFVEEPAVGDGAPRLDVRDRDGVLVVRPNLPAGFSPQGRDLVLADLMGELVVAEGIRAPWLWYYTPMALPWTRDLAASAVVYDCMDELSAFRGAPPDLVRLEAELLTRADVVFTGGHSLWEAKVGRHPAVHAVPSSVDVRHFAAARAASREDPADQAAIPHPRIGYYGVIDERLDLELIRAVAEARPEWQLVLVGPVAKLAADEVPAGPNIHRLGLKPYAELPAYLGGWDVAIMPFARNEATRYISPTKTPEYLAGGRPVVSTSIRDVVEPYGRQGLVRIADEPEAFIAAVDAALAEGFAGVQPAADRFLRRLSWDETWALMDGVVHRAVERPAVLAATEVVTPVPAAAAVRRREREAVGLSARRFERDAGSRAAAERDGAADLARVR